MAGAHLSLHPDVFFSFIDAWKVILSPFFIINTRTPRYLFGRIQPPTTHVLRCSLLLLQQPLDTPPSGRQPRNNIRWTVILRSYCWEGKGGKTNGWWDTHFRLLIESPYGKRKKSNDFFFLSFTFKFLVNFDFPLCCLSILKVNIKWTNFERVLINILHFLFLIRKANK